MLKMKTRYNDLSITARLPDELLAKIFTHSVSTDMRNFSQVRTIQVAGVCTAWRRVALNCTYLWNRVRHGRNIKWLAEIALPRSGHLPLHIFLPDENCLKGLNVILDEMHRIEHLTCYVDLLYRDEEEIQLRSDLMNSAPMLKTFKMTSRTFFKLPYYLFDRHSPKLTTLDLGNIILPPGLNFMSGLTSFEYKFARSSSEIPFSHLMDLLGAAPQLVTLELRNACSAICTKPTVHVHLPRLQHLTLADTTITCTSFLSGFIHPPTTYLEIYTDEWSSFFSEHTCKLAQELGTHIADVVSIRVAKDYWIDDAFKVELNPATESPADHAQAKLRLWKIEQIQTFITTLSLQHLQVLELQLMTQNEAILDIIGNSHCLKTLVVHSFGYVDHLSLLDGISKDEITSVHRLHQNIFETQPGRFPSFDPEDHDTNMKKSLAFMLKYASPVPGPIPFPSLKSLTMTNLRLQCKYALVTLVALVRLRANRGSSLDELHVSVCKDREKEYLTLIRDAVPSIYFNGYAMDPVGKNKDD
ncbi:hypothetical protein C0989_001230 [Termitomyces sp. Mn162]|nr:hypothetical protein C0989_001230 [Termitomyces sp. Mn162]